MFLFSLGQSQSQICSSAGCYLSQNGGLVSLPLITIAGLVDGVNPCAIGMLILLLGYLVIFAQKPKLVFRMGLIYILTVFLTYFAIGLLFYNSLHFLNLSSGRGFFNLFLGLVLAGAGFVNLKDFWLLGPTSSGKAGLRGVKRAILNFSLEIPPKARSKLLKLVEKTSVGTTIILAVLVTLLEAPCSLPIYAGTASILAQSGLSGWQVGVYFAYYNFLFVLPLIIIWFLIWKGKDMATLKEWEHKYKKWMKLSIGTVLLLMSFWIIVIK